MLFLLPLLLLFLICMFIPFYINIKFTKIDENDLFEINIFLIKGLIKISIDIPLIKLINIDNKLLLKIKNKIEEDVDENIIIENDMAVRLDKILRFIKKVKLKSYKNKEMLNAVKKYMIKKVKIEKFLWITKLGTEDAAVTGILIGFLWIIKSVFTSLILNYKKIDNLKINVIPEFNSNTIEIYFDCIIKLKLVYIIIAGYYGLKAKFKGGENNV